MRNQNIKTAIAHTILIVIGLFTLSCAVFYILFNTNPLKMILE